jgi:hypothetical protein
VLWEPSQPANLIKKLEDRSFMVDSFAVQSELAPIHLHVPPSPVRCQNCAESHERPNDEQAYLNSKLYRGICEYETAVLGMVRQWSRRRCAAMRSQFATTSARLHSSGLSLNIKSESVMLRLTVH